MKRCVTNVPMQQGGTDFFIVNLAERRSDVLVRHIDNLRAPKKR